MIKLERGVWIYIAVLFAITYAIQILAIISGGEESQLFQPLVGLTMFLPAIGAIIYLIRTGQGIKYIDWKITKPWYFIASLVIPSLITLFGIFLFEKIGWAENHDYTVDHYTVSDIDMLLLLGQDTQSIYFFMANFLVTGVVFSLLTGLMTIGEELGWRGFLQKKLLEKNGLLKSLIFLGLLWGFWHFPLIVNGFNYPEYPYWGAFLIFPLSTVFISFFMGWLTINSKSFWPAVFAHGGINSIMTLLFELDYGPNKFAANFVILGIWALVGVVTYSFISLDHIRE